tara:strand:- start:7077 stop:10073 length:2997 start_codon:yes stop_codon:yes gene_type:complete
MALISRSIPTLLRGISQSSDATKKPDHALIQDNANSDPVLGLTKRSGSQFVSNLISDETSLGDIKVHMINRDTTERYVVIFSTTKVRVFELDGTEKTVVPNKYYDTNTSTVKEDYRYLSCTSPQSEIKTITIADFTFVVNTSVTAAMDSTLSPGTETQAIVFFNQVSDKTTYSVTVDGVTATKNTASDDPLSTSTVASAIKTSLDSSLTGFTIAVNGPVLHIKKNDGSDFSIDSTDTQGNSQITTVKNSVQQFTDLPTVSPNGMVVEIIGDESTNFDNYYVRFTTNNGGAFEEGQWQETVAPGINFKFDYDTMPHVLIRQADGNFRFARVDGRSYALTHSTSGTYSQSGTTVTVTSNGHGLAVGSLVDVKITSGSGVDGTFAITSVTANTFVYTALDSLSTGGNVSYGVPNYTLPVWGERICGDLESSLTPSFIGNKINNVFFFRNRLGFLANDNVILSTVSKFFIFFPETVLSVIDSDPIDVAASHTKVAILKNAVNMGEKLILFSEQTQFVLSSSSDSLTPKTANVLVATEFESSERATPVGAGNSIYYLTNKGGFAGVREYVTQSGAQVRDAANITIHVPKLIPSDIYKIVVSTNEDVLILLGSTNSNKLYVNKWLYGNDGKKLLNAWFTYTFATDRDIKNIDFIGTDLFLVTEDRITSDGVPVSEYNLEKIPFEPNFKEPNSDYEYRLDRKVTESSTGVSVTYDATNLYSIIAMPYRLDTEMNVVTRDLLPAEHATYTTTTSNNTVTITKANHGFVTNEQVEVFLPNSNIINFSELTTKFIADYVVNFGGGITGLFLITKIDNNTFTLVSPSNLGNNTNLICTVRESSYMTTAKNEKITTSPGQKILAGNLVGGNKNVLAAGDLTHTKFIVGEPYEMHYRFASQRLTPSPGEGSELISGRLQLKHFYIKFEDTGFMKVEVTPDNNTTSTYELTTIVGTDESVIGSTTLDTGTFKVPIMSRADRVTIDVKNSTHLPTNLTSAEYEANFHMRSSRR